MGASAAKQTNGRVSASPTETTLGAAAPTPPPSSRDRSSDECAVGRVGTVRLHEKIASLPRSSHVKRSPKPHVAHRDRGTEHFSGEQKAIDAGAVAPSRSTVRRVRIATFIMGAAPLHRAFPDALGRSRSRNPDSRAHAVDSRAIQSPDPKIPTARAAD